ncbi:MAG: hypothetical protein ACI4OE_02560 [Alphaproteobacteria bacterium]|nr:hypothetical protein [Alphaproteobacteria bacterium]MDY4689608.1 hypothetical protein [Alphaproteobacteria bacterium]
MNKKLFTFLTFAAFLLALPLQADENSLHYIEKNGMKIPQAELKPEDDAFNADTAIKPLKKQLSESEQQTKDSSDLEYIDESQELPDLPCDSPKLKRQVKDFILNSLNQTDTHSVAEKRRRILTVRNLSDFTDITDEKLSGSKYFNAAAASAYLRINQKRTIKHVCESKNENSSKQFQNLHILIYPYLNYYKIVVANLAYSTEAIDKATFIYNW